MSRFPTRLDEARALARDLVAELEALEDEGATRRERLDELLRLVRRLEVRTRLERVEDADLADEADHRGLTSLPWALDGDLLAEAERRRLPLVEVEMSQQDFEREARARDYRGSLAEFPFTEIRNYLRIQGH